MAKQATVSLGFKIVSNPSNHASVPSSQQMLCAKACRRRCWNRACKRPGASVARKCEASGFWWMRTIAHAKDMIRSKPPRKTGKWNNPVRQFVAAGKVYIGLPGTLLITVGGYLAPAPETIRDYILELRTTFGWPQAYLAALLAFRL